MANGELGQRAVIFDKDGTLVDSEPHWRFAFRTFLAEHQVEWTDELQRALHGMGGISAYLIERFSLRLEAGELSMMVGEIYEKNSSEGLTLMPGAREAIEKLACRSRLAIASSNKTDLIKAEMTRLGLVDYFEVVVGGDQVKNGKPAPDIYEEAARQLDLDPELCTAVEDSPNGVESAKEAGMRCIAVPYPGTDLADFYRADLVLNSLLELEPQHIY